jgi:hypothetical protein
MLLGLLREGLISQLSHAGYLGAELAKAEAALHLDLRYRQDRPLQLLPRPSAEVAGSATTADAPPPMPRITPPLTLDQLHAASEGATVDVVLETTTQPEGHMLSGTFLDPTEKSPFSAFRRTDQTVSFRWTDQTTIVMGEPADVVLGGIFRAHGTLGPEAIVDASRVVVLSHVATIE